MHNLFTSAKQIETIVERLEDELDALAPDEMTKDAYSSCVEILQDLLTISELLSRDDTEPEDMDRLSMIAFGLAKGVIDAQAQSYSPASRDIVQRLSTAVSSIISLYYVANMIDRKAR